MKLAVRKDALVLLPAAAPGGAGVISVEDPSPFVSRRFADASEQLAVVASEDDASAFSLLLPLPLSAESASGDWNPRPAKPTTLRGDDAGVTIELPPPDTNDADATTDSDVLAFHRSCLRKSSPFVRRAFSSSSRNESADTSSVRHCSFAWASSASILRVLFRALLPSAHVDASALRSVSTASIARRSWGVAYRDRTFIRIEDDTPVLLLGGCV